MEPERDSGPDLRALFAFFLLLLLIYVSVMYGFWGTLSLSKVQAEYKERRELEDRIQASFQRREDILYHIGASTQRGERQQAALLEKQLETIDKDLDVLEDRLQDLDTRRRSGHRSKLKM